MKEVWERGESRVEREEDDEKVVERDDLLPNVPRLDARGHPTNDPTAYTRSTCPSQSSTGYMLPSKAKQRLPRPITNSTHPILNHQSLTPQPMFAQLQYHVCILILLAYATFGHLGAYSFPRSASNLIYTQAYAQQPSPPSPASTPPRTGVPISMDSYLEHRPYSVLNPNLPPLPPLSMAHPEEGSSRSPPVSSRELRSSGSIVP